MVDSFPDQDALRNVLGHFTTGVTVVTTMTAVGPIGMTANSFSSVSLDPPLVLFSVSRASQLCTHLTKTGSFAVNILNAEQQNLSRQFSRPGLHRFGGMSWTRWMTGAPILPDVLAVIECVVTDIHEGGDHFITVGRVVEAGLRAAEERRPLIFFRGAYRELSRADERPSRLE